MSGPQDESTSGGDDTAPPGSGFVEVAGGDDDRPVESWLADRVDALFGARHDSADSAVPTIVGVAGSVAVGKSHLAAELQRELQDRGLTVDVVSSDSFLRPNRELESLGISMRKGFPESFDYDAMFATVESLKSGRSVTIPEYSHVDYDIVAGSVRSIVGPDVVVLEGVNVLQPAPAGGPGKVADLLDLGVYLDAAIADIQTWFVDRFMWLCEKASAPSGGEGDGGDGGDGGFYAGFAGMDPEAIRSVAEWTWREMNEPNFRDHIRPSRLNADVIIEKDTDHRLRRIF